EGAAEEVPEDSSADAAGSFGGADDGHGCRAEEHVKRLACRPQDVVGQFGAGRGSRCHGSLPSSGPRGRVRVAPPSSERRGNPGQRRQEVSYEVPGEQTTRKPKKSSRRSNAPRLRKIINIQDPKPVWC